MMLRAQIAMAHEQSAQQLEASATNQFIGIGAPIESRNLPEKSVVSRVMRNVFPKGHGQLVGNNWESPHVLPK